MKNNYMEKIFYTPGDIVTVKQNIPNKPEMIVLKKETYLVKGVQGDSEDVLKGMRCRWFTKNQEIQEAIFSTKDLVLITKATNN